MSGLSDLWSAEDDLLTQEVLQIIKVTDAVESVCKNVNINDCWSTEEDLLSPEVLDVLAVSEIVDTCKSACKIFNLNVQSLFARISDIAFDRVLMMGDYLVFSETWAQGPMPDLPGFVCVANAKRPDLRVAGVAIYKNSTTTTTVIPHTLRKLCACYNAELGISDSFGDICAAEITANNRQILLVCLYISPDTSMKQKKLFLGRHFIKYATENVPMVVMGNFNVDLTKDVGLEFVDFMKRYFRLELTSGIKATTLGGSCVDLIFSRNIQPETKRYYSPYFYHRPILSLLQ